MRKLIGFGVAALAAVSMAGVAEAANPHFIRADADLDNAGNLDASFKMAGLGDNETITVTLSADASATYACKNNGNNFPADPKKQSVAGPVSSSGDFTSGKNGQINGTLSVSAPASTLECPNGQRVVLALVSYTNVSLSGGGDTAEIDGTFSAVLEPNFPG